MHECAPFIDSTTARTGAANGATRRASLRTPSASGGAVMWSMSSTLVAEQADRSAAPSPYGLGFASQPGLGRDERPRWRELVTLAEHYRIRQDETVDDVTWLADTARPRQGGAGQGRAHSRAPSREGGRAPPRRPLLLRDSQRPAGRGQCRADPGQARGDHPRLRRGRAVQGKGRRISHGGQVAGVSGRAPTPGSLGPG